MILTITFVSGIILYALANLIASQYQLNNRRTTNQQAYYIAEAGINYYRWHLSHAPNDYQDGTNQPGPYVHDYQDPQGQTVGYFSLDITPPPPGSYTLTIKSTGWTTDQPDLKQSITVQYGPRSLTQYVLLYDNDVSFPPGFTIYGPVHSNGGIRHDGTNTGKMTSALANYTCNQKNGGCTPPATQNGIWGTGGDQGLWEFPVPPIDFAAINIDFAQLKTTANSVGLYQGPSGSWGYHVVFTPEGLVNVYRVTQVNNFKGGKGNPGCDQLYGEINNQTLINTYTSADLPLIFIEDNVWIDGTVTNPTTIVAAKFPLENNKADIWINGNLVYANKNGTIQTGVISQRDIILHRDIPNDFEINAALLAQSGQVIRHDYGVSCAGNPSTAVRNSFTFFGSLISSQVSKWNWDTSSTSGFTTGTITYDAVLKETPPPYFPTTGEYDFISWTE